MEVGALPADFGPGLGFFLSFARQYKTERSLGYFRQPVRCRSQSLSAAVNVPRLVRRLCDRQRTCLPLPKSFRM